MANYFQPPEEMRQQIKESFKVSINKIVTHAAKNKTVTPAFINMLTELVFQFTENCICRDLLAFSQHAKHKNKIMPEDALLISRKTQYHDYLRDFLTNQLDYELKVKNK